jgi:hypothetical protein
VELSSFVETMMMEDIDAATGGNEIGSGGRDGQAVLDELLVEPGSLDQPLDLSGMRDSTNRGGLPTAMPEPEPEPEPEPDPALFSQASAEEVGRFNQSQLLEEAAAMSAEPDPTSSMILDWLPEPMFDISTAPDDCASCRQALKKKNKFVGRYCHYYGQHYCKSCHKGDKVIIPARLVKEWDRKKYEVCREARDFLRAHMDRPMIDLMQANPGLYAEVDGRLQKLHDVRMKFSMMKVSRSLSFAVVVPHLCMRPLFGLLRCHMYNVWTGSETLRWCGCRTIYSNAQDRETSCYSNSVIASTIWIIWSCMRFGI